MYDGESAERIGDKRTWKCTKNVRRRRSASSGVGALIVLQPPPPPVFLRKSEKDLVHEDVCANREGTCKLRQNDGIGTVERRGLRGTILDCT